MHSKNQAGNIDLLNHKIDSMEKLGDSKYASSKDFSDLYTLVKVQEEKIKRLEDRFNDYLSTKKYMTATTISIVSLIVVIISSLLNYFK